MIKLADAKTHATTAFHMACVFVLFYFANIWFWAFIGSPMTSSAKVWLAIILAGCWLYAVISTWREDKKLDAEVDFELAVEKEVERRLSGG